MPIARTILCGAAAFALTAAGLPAADRIALRGGEAYDGSFQGFKNNRFYFQPTQGELLRETADKVQSLTLDPPVTVTLKPLGKKPLKDVKLLSFAAPAFVFRADGAEQKLPATHVTSIDTSGDLRRAMAHAAAAPAAPAEAVKIEKLLKPGDVTVIHFHMASSAASLRLKAHAENVAQRHKGKMKVATVEIAGWDDPTAKLYDVRSVPQFWIYGRNGTLLQKLEGDVTPATIDAALAAALKSPGR